MLRFSMGDAILNKLMNLLISLARDVVVPPRPRASDLSARHAPPVHACICAYAPRTAAHVHGHAYDGYVTAATAGAA